MSVDSEVQALIDASIDTFDADFDTVTAALEAIEMRLDALESTPVTPPAVGPRPAPAIPAGAKFLGPLDDTGHTDVRAQLQAAIDDLEAGDTLVFAQTDTEGHQWPDEPVSTYRIDSEISMSSLPDDVTLWGYGVRIVRNGTGKMLRMRTAGVDGLTIRGFELRGSNEAYARTTGIYTAPGSEFDAGIQLAARHTNSTIEDCLIHYMRGDGIWQVAWPTTDWTAGAGTQYITVRYCTIEDNARQGVTMSLGLDWHVHHCLLGNQGGFNLNSEDQKTSDYTLPSLSWLIEDNTFEQTCWAKATFVGMTHISSNWGWNDSDGPPNFTVVGPLIARRNSVTGFVPDGAGWVRSSDRIGFWRISYYGSTPYTGTWSDYTRIDGVEITDNEFDLPVSEQIANIEIRLRAVDGVVVDGNTLQGTSVDVPTSGYGANTDVSGSDV